jgi:hypothetical protein
MSAPAKPKKNDDTKSDPTEMPLVVIIATLHSAGEIALPSTIFTIGPNGEISVARLTAGTDDVKVRFLLGDTDATIGAPFTAVILGESGPAGIFRVWTHDGDNVFWAFIPAESLGY